MKSVPDYLVDFILDAKVIKGHKNKQGPLNLSSEVQVVDSFRPRCAATLFFRQTFTNNWPSLLEESTLQDIRKEDPRLLRRSVITKERLLRKPIYQVATDKLSQADVTDAMPNGDIFLFSNVQRDPMPFEALPFVIKEACGDDFVLQTGVRPRQLWSVKCKELDIELEADVFLGESLNELDQILMLHLYAKDPAQAEAILEICRRIDKTFNNPEKIAMLEGGISADGKVIEFDRSVEDNRPKMRA
jgi:hypothetical protein